MKKSILNLFSMCLVLIFITACSSDDKFEGSDNLVTITRDLSSFDRIIAQDDLDVNVVQGSSQLVEIIVNDNLQNQIKTNVRNDVLTISLESGSYNSESFEINIQLPNLDKLQLDDNTRANVNFASDQLEFEINDSSTLTLRGASDVLHTDVNDDGRIKGFSFITNILNTSSSDASEIEITCNSEINGTVDDAAKVRYRKMPIINAKTSDDGRIINAN